MTNNQAAHDAIAAIIDDYLDAGQPFNNCMDSKGKAWTGAGHDGTEDCQGCRQIVKALLVQRNRHHLRGAGRAR